MSSLEHWQRGPVEGIGPLLQPAAHALLQALDDVAVAVRGLTTGEVSLSPGGAASLAFHLRHLAGSTDRLFTYARGESLSAGQREALRREQSTEGTVSAEALLDEFRRTVVACLGQLRATRESTLLERREVGRQRIPSNVLGLLFHAAEHAQRHAGQVVATARIVRGLQLVGGEARHPD